MDAREHAREILTGRNPTEALNFTAGKSDLVEWACCFCAAANLFTTTAPPHSYIGVGSIYSLFFVRLFTATAVGTVLTCTATAVGTVLTCKGA